MSNAQEILSTKIEYSHQFSEKKQQLTQIKENLNNIINSEKLKVSLFTRASIYWKTVPNWQKFVVGSLFILPLILGITLSMPVCIALSMFSFTIYCASSFLLSNHENEHESNKNHLKQAIEHLVPMLETLILALDALHQNLGLELDKFHKENERLNGSLEILNKQLLTSEAQIKKLEDIENGLLKSEGELKGRVRILNDKSDEQLTLIEQNETKLRDAVEKYNSSQRELSEKIREFTAVKNNLTEKNGELESINLDLTNSFEHYKRLASLDMAKQKEERSKIEGLLDDTRKNYAQAFQEIDKIGQHLNETSNAYADTAIKMKLLLGAKEELLKTLEKHSRNLTASNYPMQGGFFSSSLPNNSLPVNLHQEKQSGMSY